MKRLVLMGAVTGLALTAGLAAQTPNDWPTVGNDPGGMKYSSLTQITPANVSKLDESVDLRHGRAGIGLHGHAHCREQRHVLPGPGIDHRRAQGRHRNRAVEVRPGEDPRTSAPIPRPAAAASRTGRALPRVAPRIVIATTNGFIVQLDAKIGQADSGPCRRDQPLDRRDGEVRRRVLHEHASGALQEPGDRRRPDGRAGPLRDSRRSARVRSADGQGSLALPRRAAAGRGELRHLGPRTAGRIGAVPASGCR